MNKSTLTALVVSGFCMVAGEAQAKDMEKCKIVGTDGKGLIKPKMCDCAVKGEFSCAGQNPSGDAGAWIFVPKGVCEKILGGTVVN